MPYVTATLAGIELLTGSGDNEGKGVFQKGIENASGIQGRRDERNLRSEIKGAQNDAIQAAKDKAIADQQNADNRALGANLRRRARQGAAPAIDPGLGSVAPGTVGKSVLGA